MAAADQTTHTVGGLDIAASKIGAPFTIDLTGSLANARQPNRGNTQNGGQLGFDAQLLDNLLLAAHFGLTSTIDLRGNLDAGLVALPDWKLGWMAGYRTDTYLATSAGQGTTTDNLSKVSMKGSQDQGVNARLSLQNTWNGLALYLAPELGILSNRSLLAASIGVDYTFTPIKLSLGYGLNATYNFTNPAAYSINPFEAEHTVGMRYELDDTTYLQANYSYKAADTYGTQEQKATVGVNYRLIQPEPKATVRQPEPQVAAIEKRSHLAGQVFYTASGSAAVNGQAVKVALKVSSAKGWTNFETSTLSDASGRYAFENTLPPGQYQIVFRNTDKTASLVGAGVSDPVSVSFDTRPTLDMDLGWDESAIKATITKGRVNVTWPAKPGVQRAVYQVVLREDPEDSQTDVLSFPESPTTGTQGSFDISPSVKGKKLYFFVKYWKQDGKFNGGNFYGQSLPQQIQLP